MKLIQISYPYFIKILTTNPWLIIFLLLTFLSAPCFATEPRIMTDEQRSPENNPVPFNQNTQTASSKIISLNFQDIKVKALLQLLAEYSGQNIIVNESITGNISLHLEKIPWDQALNIVLKSQGLGRRQVGNVIIIAPIAEIAAKEKQALEAEKQMEDLSTLQSELLQIHYGKATAIAEVLKTQGTSLLSSRGSINSDARTNTIWVQDIPKKLIEVKQLVNKLDIPVRQVLIEARIVNVDKSFEEELGVRFGLSNPQKNISGSLAGANALAQGINPENIPLNQRLNMDLPAITPGATSMGLALAYLGKGTLIDLELSALESEGGGKIISSPRLITADQQEAQIQAGEEIPYQQATTSGATSVAFKNAVLSLNVTPQITPEGKIILTLKVNQDKVGSRNISGVPSIDTRQIETQVVVENGETIVLGGIYETDNKKMIQRVPILGSLPLVGVLFRHNQWSNKCKELLIFVTPRIFNHV